MVGPVAPRLFGGKRPPLFLLLSVVGTGIKKKEKDKKHTHETKDGLSPRHSLQLLSKSLLHRSLASIPTAETVSCIVSYRGHYFWQVPFSHFSSDQHLLNVKRPQGLPGPTQRRQLRPEQNNSDQHRLLVLRPQGRMKPTQRLHKSS